MATAKPLTTGKIAKYCKVNVKTVLKWIADGKLQAYQLPSGENRIAVTNFISFLVSYDMPVPEAFQKSLQPKILIVDDDELVVSSIKRNLKKETFLIESATNAFMAGKQIGAFKPDLILLDLQMPGLNGYDVLRYIREDASTSHIKVVIVSGHVSRKDNTELLKLEVNGILEKPISKDELLKVVAKFKREYVHGE